MTKCIPSFTEPSYKIIFGTKLFYKLRNSTYIWEGILKYLIKALFRRCIS